MISTNRYNDEHITNIHDTIDHSVAKANTIVNAKKIVENLKSIISFFILMC